ncbi:MAG: SRPBCC family protein [Acidimicrobiia bacterium]
MTEQVSVTRDVDAPAEQVWTMVSDVTRMGEWSPENVGGTWLGGATGPQPGARFRGTNRNGTKKWNTVATVVDAEPGRRFSFRVTAAGRVMASSCPGVAGCTRQSRRRASADLATTSSTPRSK